jgi:hypothetical protein
MVGSCGANADFYNVTLPREVGTSVYTAYELRKKRALEKSVGGMLARGKNKKRNESFYESKT